MAGKRYVAVVGCRNYFEPKLLKPGLVLKLVKEPENLYDEEAIRAELEPFGKVGYVANSVHTVPRGCASAGRIYDTFKDSCYGVVRFVVGDTAILELLKALHVGVVIHEDLADDRISGRLYQESGSY
ncbi:MAG TPA: DNA-binding protein [Firmicutes bacterium]|nr:DNA-binding protein [Bacillota bacterium]